MIQRRISSLRWTILIGVIAFMAACGGDDESSKPPQPDSTGEPTAIEGVSTLAAFPLSVPRSDGATLSIAAPPARLVSLSPSATEVIYAIGAEASLVAVDTAADYPAAAAQFATRLDANAPNLDAIAALNPDLVVVGSNNGNIVQALGARDIPTFFQDEADIVTVADVFTQIALLGRITGKQTETETLLSQLDGRVNAVTDAVQGLSQATGPKVYHEVAPQLRTASDSSLEGDLYRLLRARNIAGAGAGTPYPQLTQDTVIAANPDVIIVTQADGSPAVDEVSARPGWAGITAVREGRLFPIDEAVVSRRGPRIVDALEQLAKALHPDRFQ